MREELEEPLRLQMGSEYHAIFSLSSVTSDLVQCTQVENSNSLARPEITFWRGKEESGYNFWF